MAGKFPGNQYAFIMRNMFDKRFFTGITQLALISLLTITGCASSPVSSYQAFATFQDTLDVGGKGPELVVIPAGQFNMGANTPQTQSYPTENPTHTVTISRPFAIGKFEVTFREYDKFVDATGYEKPSDLGWGTKYWGREKTPVFNVSWHDARRYLEWLSSQTGARYRLPTEAEWEYSARAGSTTIFSTGNCINANQANFHDKEQFEECSTTGIYRGKAIETGNFPPNNWGLHDVHGNVLEWTEDCFHDGYKHAPNDGSAWLDSDNANCTRRILRGGSWSGRAVELRSASRASNFAEHKSTFIGFRVVRELD